MAMSSIAPRLGDAPGRAGALVFDIQHQRRPPSCDAIAGGISAPLIQREADGSRNGRPRSGVCAGGGGAPRRRARARTRDSRGRRSSCATNHFRGTRRTLRARRPTAPAAAPRVRRRRRRCPPRRAPHRGVVVGNRVSTPSRRSSSRRWQVREVGRGWRATSTWRTTDSRGSPESGPATRRRRPFACAPRRRWRSGCSRRRISPPSACRSSRTVVRSMKGRSARAVSRSP